MRNRAVRSRAKTFITRAEKLVFAGEMESAQAAVAESISALDGAAERGVIHSNNAARRKARLMKKLNQAQAQASAAEVVEEEAAEAEGAEEKKEAAEKKPKAKKKKKSK